MKALRPSALGLTIGLVSGVFAYLAGMPLAWMLGSMIGVTIAALAHVPLASPNRLRPIVIPVIGVMLGSAITPQIFGRLGDWGLMLLPLPIVLVLMGAASYVIYRRVGGYDPATAFFSSMPGGLNEMLLLGSAVGADERRIALAHATRVLFVIFLIALSFGLLLGVRSGGGNSWVPLSALTLKDSVILLTCAVLGVRLAKLVRLPAASIFGPMILSGIAHVAGWVTVAPPTIVIIAAQVVIGTVIGGRFVGTRLREVGIDVGLALLTTTATLAIAVTMAVVVTLFVDMPLAQTVLAYAPGGLTEMSLLTLAIGQDIAFVSVTHILRITVVVGVAPALFGIWRRWS